MNTHLVSTGSSLVLIYVIATPAQANIPHTSANLTLHYIHQRYLNFGTPVSRWAEPDCYCQKKPVNFIRFPRTRSHISRHMHCCRLPTPSPRGRIATIAIVPGEVIERRGW